MINFHVLSLFPNLVKNYTEESILKKAAEKKILNFYFYNLRDFANNKHSKVDDKPYGGGPGMLINAEVVLNAIDFIKSEILKKHTLKSKPKIKIILFKPNGEKLNTNLAKKFSKEKNIILIAGRYEGIDSRVEKILKPEIISVGDFVLTGGELPSAIFIDTVSRQVKGVLGDFDSLEENRDERDEFYTRPETLVYKNKKYKVPEVLLSGDHAKIKSWKKKSVLDSFL